MSFIPAQAPRPTPVFDALLLTVAALGSKAAEIDRFKRDCRRMIRLYTADPWDPTVFARYGARARQLQGWNIAAAVAFVECRYWSERRRTAGPRLSEMVLREARLLLRLMRAKRLELEPVIADVLGEDRVQAAE